MDEKCSLSDIDQRVSDLREEKRKIEDVYKKLSKFLCANAILPLNDDILEYLKHFLKEEQMKGTSGRQNNDIIQGIEKMMNDYEEEMKLFKETIKNDKDPSNSKDVVKSDEIFTLVGTLYRLPINGAKIREQVQGLQMTHANISAQRELFVELPSKANSSIVMLQFQDFISSQ